MKPFAVSINTAAPVLLYATSSCHAIDKVLACAEFWGIKKFKLSVQPIAPHP